MYLVCTLFFLQVLLSTREMFLILIHVQLFVQIILPVLYSYTQTKEIPVQITVWVALDGLNMLARNHMKHTDNIVLVHSHGVSE